MSIYDELLFIREKREERAARAAAQQRNALLIAQEGLQRAKLDLETFKAFSSRRETTIYRELCGRVVTVKDLQLAQEQVLNLRNKEIAIDNLRRDKEKIVNVESSKLDLDIQRHALASRLRDKFLEVSCVENAALQREIALNEEREMEDIVAEKGVSLLWGNLEEHIP